MNSSTSKQKLSATPSEGTLNLSKLGGNDWINIGRYDSSKDGQKQVPKKTPQHKIFAKQADAINNSTAINQMLQSQREKKQRQFVPSEK